MLNAHRQSYNPLKVYEKYTAKKITYNDLLVEFSHELYHQGSVDTAAYAMAPDLVEDYNKRKDNTGTLLELLANIFMKAGQGENPEPQGEIKESFDQAADKLYAILVERILDNKGEQNLDEIKRAMAFLAFKNKEEKLAEFMNGLEEVDL